MRTLLCFRDRKHFSYGDDWCDSFVACSRLSVQTCNLSNRDWIFILPKIREFDLVILLHSVAQTLDELPLAFRIALQLRRGRLAVFFRNEFKLFQEKRLLANRLGADFICSQLPISVADYLYGDLGGQVLPMAHALNPKVFLPGPPIKDRSIDFGARTVAYPGFLGDDDRNRIIHFFQNDRRISKSRVDISTDQRERFDREGWRDFLSRCRATVSCEAGASFVEPSDQLRKEIERELESNPSLTMNQIRSRFDIESSRLPSGKCISSRHFEAIGTKTLQVMFAGKFNDILVPDRHYISLAQDFSNCDSVLDRIRDYEFCQRMVDETREYIMSEHTYAHRVEKFLFALD